MYTAHLLNVFNSFKKVKPMIECVEFTDELALQHVVIYSFVHGSLEFNLPYSQQVLCSSRCDGFQVTAWNTAVLQISQLHQATRQLIVQVYTNVEAPQIVFVCVCVCVWPCKGCSVRCTASPKHVTFGNKHQRF